MSQCLEKVSPSQNARPDVDMLLSDGADIVNLIRPRAMKTFHEYSQQVFLPFFKVSRVVVIGTESSIYF